ncbi:hypothetical protein [Burkholderia phage vB_BglM_WTB]
MKNPFIGLKRLLSSPVPAKTDPARVRIESMTVDPIVSRPLYRHEFEVFGRDYEDRAIRGKGTILLDYKFKKLTEEDILANYVEMPDVERGKAAMRAREALKSELRQRGIDFDPFTIGAVFNYIGEDDEK